VSSEVIRLTAKFKLKEAPKGLDNLFSTYREIVNCLITYAHENNITSFYRLKEETYKILREKYPELPLITSTPRARWPRAFTRAIARGRGEEKPMGGLSSRRT